MKFSILIPVYNTEKYVCQCLDSVLQQDYNDYEIILVNDGSTDGSLDICKKYAEKNSRIKLYDKENEGLLLTRRFSLKHSSGEYILFLDSDDYWEEHVLSRLDDILHKQNVDMVLYRYKRIKDDGTFVCKDINVFPDDCYFDNSNKVELARIFASSSRLNNLWIKCVKREIIDINEDYSAFRDKKGEDILQSLPLFYNANSFYYTNEIFVNYRLSENGRGRNFKEKYIEDFNCVREQVFLYLKRLQTSDDIIKEFYIYYIKCIIPFYITYGGMQTVKYQDFLKQGDIIRNYDLFKRAMEQRLEPSINTRIAEKTQNGSLGLVYLYAKLRGTFHRLRK